MRPVRSVLLPCCCVALWTTAAAMAGQGGPALVEETAVASDGRIVEVSFEQELLYDAGVRHDFARPVFVAVGPDGTLYVSDFGDKDFGILDDRGTKLRTVGQEGEGPGEFQDAWVIAVSPSGSRVYVWDRVGARLHAFSPDGTFDRALALPIEFGLADPRSLYAMDDSTLVVGTVLPSRSEGGSGVHLLEIVPSGERSELRLRTGFGSTPSVSPHLYPFVAGGTASPDLDGGILYAQASPYALIKFDREGRELWRVEDEGEFPHWREFFGRGPDGTPEPRLFDYVAGWWPVREGLYLVQIRMVSPGYEEPEFTGPLYRSRYQLLWLSDGAVTRTVDLDGPQDMELKSRDHHGRFMGIWTSDSIVRSTLRVTVDR